MPKSNEKGGEYERDKAKQLSKWWTRGERDDVFWRSSQSGGRATQRAKSGKRTAGSYGDIASLDPIGEYLMKFATIECKRGSSWGSPGDLLDATNKGKVRPFEAALMQAHLSHLQAHSFTWWLICRRDFKVDVIYMPTRVLKVMEWVPRPSIRYRLNVNQVDDFPMSMDFVGTLLAEFLDVAKPGEIIRRVKQEFAYE